MYPFGGLNTSMVKVYRNFLYHSGHRGIFTEGNEVIALCTSVNASLT
jgi:hypothetical protein